MVCQDGNFKICLSALGREEKKLTNVHIVHWLFILISLSILSTERRGTAMYYHMLHVRERFQKKISGKVWFFTKPWGMVILNGNSELLIVVNLMIQGKILIFGILVILLILVKLIIMVNLVILVKLFKLVILLNLMILVNMLNIVILVNIVILAILEKW